jgi:hypothetical protein
VLCALPPFTPAGQPAISEASRALRRSVEELHAWDVRRQQRVAQVSGIVAAQHLATCVARQQVIALLVHKQGAPQPPPVNTPPPNAQIPKPQTPTPTPTLQLAVRQEEHVYDGCTFQPVINDSSRSMALDTWSRSPPDPRRPWTGAPALLDRPPPPR